MANNLIMKTVSLSTSYQPLSNIPQLGSGELHCPPTNSGIVYVKSAGDEQQWIAGEYHFIPTLVDLHTIEVKGVSGDIIKFTGSTGGTFTK
jgi:hypothetical protein